MFWFYLGVVMTTLTFACTVAFVYLRNGRTDAETLAATLLLPFLGTFVFLSSIPYFWPIDRPKETLELLLFESGSIRLFSFSMAIWLAFLALAVLLVCHEEMRQRNELTVRSEK
ncbi:MAG: hypothetical protein HYT03_01790 [Candidatus Harrisonbacteria bacterium]|nr:hypothetical protein [Candidatus Harrisonbacteria bacterium]